MLLTNSIQLLSLTMNSSPTMSLNLTMNSSFQIKTNLTHRRSWLNSHSNSQTRRMLTSRPRNRHLSRSRLVRTEPRYKPQWRYQNKPVIY
jgi:hypothetical protein